MDWMCLLALLAPPQDKDPVTVETLLREMTDLDRLTRPANYACRQFSSYDRASDRGDAFANNDCGNYLRVENGWHVLAEAPGPGAIVRIWSANPGGTIRIWLDGEVALEEDFFKLATGRIPPFVPPYGQETSQGRTLYFPFPYAKSMKVATSKGGQFYQVNVRTYSPDTKIKTFSRDQLGKPPKLECAVAGESATEGKQMGPGTVRRLEVKLPGDPAELRRKSLRIVVDGEPCVACPLGDFFGTSPGRTSYETLAVGITKEGSGYCNFPIPFEKTLEVDVDAPLTMRITRDSRPLRFHAWWNGKKNYKTRPMSEWPVLAGAGRGRYVGTALYVRNPVKEWWGEGDEKVTVDGEKFPSTFGTGTEDYFGYAWCDPHPFAHAYHSQSRCDGPGNRGFTAVNRFHVLDDIPFDKSIRFDLEVWHWAECTMGYATVAYWYAEPGFRLSGKEPPAEERELVEVPPVRRVSGAQEGEKLKILEKTGIAEPQDLSWTEGFSMEGHLWWRDARPGDVLRIEFASEMEGKRTLILAMTKAKDYGIVKLSVNGVVIDEKRDLYDPNVVPTGEIAYEADLKKGANELKVEIVGTNPKANPKNHMFGLDYVRVE